MAKKSASQEDFEALVDEVARLEVDLLRITQFNRCLALGLNNAWTILDRLTGRRPEVLKETHVHQWRFVRPATFMSGDGFTYGEGVTETCACGAVRSRVTAWLSPAGFEA